MTYQNFDYLNYYNGIRKETGDLGIEVEVESRVPIPTIKSYYWDTKGDGSLRNYGYEMITIGAIPKNKASSVLEELFNYLATPEYQVVTNCVRTSIHVHQNIQDLTPVQTWTNICAYYLLENLLFKYCGENREGNHFCLRLKDAEAALGFMIKDLQEDLPFWSFRTDRLKYLAGNVNAIPRFGSFEWRGMSGNYNKDYVLEWLYAITYLKEASKQYGSPALLLDRYWNVGGDLVHELLPANFVKLLIKDNKDWAELIKENSGLIAQVAYFHDWNKYQRRTDTLLEQKKKSMNDYKKESFQFWEQPVPNFGPQRRNVNVLAGLDNVDF